MKKLILIFAFLGAAFAAQAQVTIGPKVGLNISNYTGPDIKADAMVGFHLGGLINIGVGKVFSVQPEVLFSTQGAKVYNGNEKVEFKTTYVTVPVMLKFRGSKGFYFEVGPQVGFKTSDKTGDETINNFANNLDLAAGAGLGYQAPGGLGIGARYIAGLSKVGDFDSSDINPDFKNSVIQVSLFYIIGANK